MPKSPMPKLRPAPPELTSRFADLLAGIPDAVPRKMFGYLAGFTNGNMFAGIFQDSIVVKLPEPDRLALQKAGGKPFEPMPGRVMREYVVVPPAVLSSPIQMKRWLEKARDFAAALPPKGANKSAAKKSTTRKSVPKKSGTKKSPAKKIGPSAR
jgi:TfoX/Sxy family transcriptional regulator of competence genes